jgi:predicted nuclease of predicted toxin-antitoxin system
VKFKADENLPIEIAALLRSAAHDALTVGEQKLQGETDPHIIEICKQEERILLALDLDFSDIRTYPPQKYPGIIVLRLRYQDKPHVSRQFSESYRFLRKNKSHNAFGSSMRAKCEYEANRNIKPPAPTLLPASVDSLQRVQVG